MAGTVDELIDVLYGMVEEAWSVPLGKFKCVLEREKVLDLLDEIRANLPTEIKAAKEIVEKRNEILAAAKREGESIKKAAEDRSRQMLNQNEIVLMAKEKANELVTTSQSRSMELKRAAGDYCDDILKATEDSVATTLQDIKKLRAQFKSASGGLPSASAGKSDK